MRLFYLCLLAFQTNLHCLVLILQTGKNTVCLNNLPVELKSSCLLVLGTQNILNSNRNTAQSTQFLIIYFFPATLPIQFTSFAIVLPIFISL